MPGLQEIPPCYFQHLPPLDGAVQLPVSGNGPDQPQERGWQPLLHTVPFVLLPWEALRTDVGRAPGLSCFYCTAHFQWHWETQIPFSLCSDRKRASSKRWWKEDGSYPACPGSCCPTLSTPTLPSAGPCSRNPSPSFTHSNLGHHQAHQHPR